MCVCGAKKPNSDKMYISQPSYKDFISETQDYLEKIFQQNSLSIIVLHLVKDSFINLKPFLKVYFFVSR